MRIWKTIVLLVVLLLALTTAKALDGNAVPESLIEVVVDSEPVNVLSYELREAVPEKVRDLNFETVSQGLYSGYVDAANLVIDDVNTWRKVWNKTSNALVELDPPEVDFKSFTLIGVYGGEAELNLDVKVEQVLQDVNGLRVLVERFIDDTGSSDVNGTVQPYHIIKLPRLDLQVVFEELVSMNAEKMEGLDENVSIDGNAVADENALAEADLNETGITRIRSVSISPETAVMTVKVETEEGLLIKAINLNTEAGEQDEEDANKPSASEADLNAVEATAPKVSAVIEGTKVEISVAESTVIISSEDVSAETPNQVELEENRLYISSPSKKSQVNILPDRAVAIARVSDARNIELVFSNGTPVYRVKGQEEGRLLGLLSVEFGVEKEIHAQTGQVLKEEKPWWAFLVFG